MSRYIYQLTFILGIVLSIGVFSCSKDSIELNENSSDEEIANAVFNQIITEWNAPSAEIQKYMKNYVLEDMDGAFLKYTDNSGLIRISYAFSHDSLGAAIVIVPKMDRLTICDFLDGYEKIGDLSSKAIYYDMKKNTMCCLYDITDEEEQYSVIGFAPIESDLYVEVEPIVVITGDAVDVTESSVKICSSATGCSKRYQIGVRYSTNSDFSDFKEKSQYINGSEYKFTIYGLLRSTKYYYKSYVKIDDYIYYGETKTFTTVGN